MNSHFTKLQIIFTFVVCVSTSKRILSYCALVSSYLAVQLLSGYLALVFSYLRIDPSYQLYENLEMGQFGVVKLCIIILIIIYLLLQRNLFERLRNCNIKSVASRWPFCLMKFV